MELSNCFGKQRADSSLLLSLDEKIKMRVFPNLKVLPEDKPTASPFLFQGLPQERIRLI
jgi:hypothetical protein